MQYSFQRMSWL